MSETETLLDKVVSLCKRRGFIFPSSEIYGGFSGFWDYGPLGAQLKQNIKDLWWDKFVSSREDMYGVSTSIIMNPKVWEAAGHVERFGDELFKTKVGTQDEATTSYLRPETAQGMFVNFKNVMDSLHPEVPFGLAQIGRAFRNEISPRDFLFRAREFEQMEVEYFIRESEWEKYFEYWRREMHDWFKMIGLEKGVHELDVLENERAHYSKKTIDFEFDYPFGKNELCGLAYRGDFDLKNHFGAGDWPHVIEPSFGVDRLVLALLLSAYSEDELGGEKRMFLKLDPKLAPVKVAVFPLLRNKPELIKKAREVYEMVRKEIPAVEWDDNGNIGKRYRRQDEIGTPFCVTIDFQTLDDDTVTIRSRDTGEQERVKVGDLTKALAL